MEDAELAAELGVDALGFVFYPPSPRYIEPRVAADIIAKLPPFITATGLVVNSTPEAVNELISTTQIDLVQCHGDESSAQCEMLSRPYIKAIRVKSKSDILSALESYQSARALLLDAFVPGVPGGTGQTFDWTTVEMGNEIPYVLAGGITVTNVGDAIKNLRPYAIDVSSGIESRPGVKDPAKMAEFMKVMAKANGEY